ncbi:MAG: nucleoside phosphorylase [Anaerolineaceae bacterium]
MDSDLRMPSLRVLPSDIAGCVLVVGDPQRAEEASHLLENAKEVGFFREYRTFTGFYQGKRISISSHGVGSSGANICFHELIKCGAHTIIRAGTCGAMVKGIHDGELIIATGALREDGCSEHLAPMSYPAISDRHVVTALETSASQHGIPHPHVGLVITQAYFYPGMLPSEADVWLKTELVMAVEMELATLLVMAGLNKVRAGGIFTSDGNLTEEPDPNIYDPHRKVVSEGKAEMLKIALDALVTFA